MIRLRQRKPLPIFRHYRGLCSASCPDRGRQKIEESPTGLTVASQVGYTQRRPCWYADGRVFGGGARRQIWRNQQEEGLKSVPVLGFFFVKL